MMGRRLWWAAAVCLATYFGGTPSRAALDCKEVFVGRSRASDPVNTRARDQAALDGAIAHWRKQVRQSYGWDYRFWTAARNKAVRCTGAAGVRSCSVSARPCRKVG